MFEIWDKRRKSVVWMSRDCPEMLDEGEPPLDFRDFFPCPEPCYGSRASKSLIPTPDYRYYQDQCQEIDDLTEKIANLTDFLIVRGFIPAGPSADGADAIRMLIQQMQSDMTANKTTFIPVESWAGFAEKGGAKGLIDWFPVENVLVSLKGAIEARQQLIQDVYQITGYLGHPAGRHRPGRDAWAPSSSRRSPVAGASATPRMTWPGSARISPSLFAEVVAEQFQPQTIADMTGFKYMPPMPTTGGMNGMGALPAGPPGIAGGAPLNCRPLPSHSGGMAPPHLRWVGGASPMATTPTCPARPGRHSTTACSICCATTICGRTSSTSRPTAPSSRTRTRRNSGGRNSLLRSARCSNRPLR